jgi:hypothetical protein
MRPRHTDGLRLRAPTIIVSGSSTREEGGTYDLLDASDSGESRQVSTTRDEELERDEVQPSSHLSDGVLDLQPRVDLEEEKLSRSTILRIHPCQYQRHEEMNGPRTKMNSTVPAPSYERR